MKLSEILKTLRGAMPYFTFKSIGINFENDMNPVDFFIQLNSVLLQNKHSMLMLVFNPHLSTADSSFLAQFISTICTHVDNIHLELNDANDQQCPILWNTFLCYGYKTNPKLMITVQHNLYHQHMIPHTGNIRDLYHLSWTHITQHNDFQFYYLLGLVNLVKMNTLFSMWIFSHFNVVIDNKTINYHLDVCFHQGHNLIRSNKKSEAITFFDYYLRNINSTHPLFMETNTLLGYLYESLGQHERAIQYYGATSHSYNQATTYHNSLLDYALTGLKRLSVTSNNHSVKLHKLSNNPQYLFAQPTLEISKTSAFEKYDYQKSIAGVKKALAKYN